MLSAIGGAGWMPRGDFSRGSDLTGLWSGSYWYANGPEPTPFSAHITDTAGDLVGTTLEPATFGDPALDELSADLSGSRGGFSVRFTKLYHPAPGVHRDPIFYSGTVDEQFTMIDGEWTSFGLAGRFVMVRASGGAKAEAVRETAEPLAIRR